MKVTEFTKRALSIRRERRDLTKRGYEYREPLLEIICGFRQSEKITDVKISVSGKGLYIKTEAK